jgi:PAS domain S-box-containing protein
MRPEKKSRQVRPRAPVKRTAISQKVLQACAQLPLLNHDSARLRTHIAETAKEILGGLAAGIILQSGETYIMGALAAPEAEAIGKSALLSHAKSFAVQAIEQSKPVHFRFSSPRNARSVYHGIAEPLVTSQSVAALLVLKDKAFTVEQVAALQSFGSIARLSLENSELVSLSSAQQQHLDQLLQISSDLGATSHLDSFLNKFVVRAAEFLAFERAFVAMAEGGECRVRWGCVNGVANPLNIEISTESTRRILETKQPFVSDNVSQTPPADEKSKEVRTAYRINQYIGVPLITSTGRVLGILGLLDKKGQARISDNDVHRAKALAAEVTVALDAAQNLHLSEQHRKRAESLMEMALDLGSALRLPEFVKNFTSRVAGMMQAHSAVLALAQGSKLETVGFYGIKLERSMQRSLNTALNQFAEKYPDLKVTGSGIQALGRNIVDQIGWQNLTLVRLEGAEGDLLGIFCLADITKELMPNDLNLLQALIGHASVALENARLFSRIAQASRQWAEIFDSISDYIVVHDDQCRVLRVNRSLAEFIGVTPAELIGLSMRSLIAISPDITQPCPFCRNESNLGEYFHPSLERSYLVSTSRIHGALYEGMQTIHVLKDITDRREAERRYRELFDNVQEGVFFSSPEGCFIEVNDALVRMLGYDSREELLKLDIPTQLYVSPEQRDRVARDLESSGSVRNLEVALRRRDGSLIHALENAFVVRDSQNRVLQYRGVLLDITDVKNVQAQLQRERDFSGKILNNTQTMIMVADTAGLISYANRRCYEAGAFDEQALVGNRLDRIIATHHIHHFREAFDSSLHGKQVDNLELMIVRGNGSQGKFSVNLSPMRDESGDVTSVVVLMTDITDAAIIQAKLMHTEKMAAVGQLVSGVAHEVNNPLTAIMGFSDLLMENPEVPESARKDLKVILEEAHRTREIVKNLLSFARQRPPQRHKMQVNSVLHKTVALRSYDLSNYGVEVIKSFDENVSDIVGDSHQLQQVFLNILNNAFDAVCATERKGQIEIITRQDNDYVEVLFRDNGEGIKHPERIFDPFFTTKEVGKGTGLGLSICYGIVREHEGEILCSNNQTMPGATFTVRLPLKTRADYKFMAAAGSRM